MIHVICKTCQTTTVTEDGMVGFRCRQCGTYNDRDGNIAAGHLQAPVPASSAQIRRCAHCHGSIPYDTNPRQLMCARCIYGEAPVSTPQRVVEDPVAGASRPAMTATEQLIGRADRQPPYVRGTVERVSQLSRSEPTRLRLSFSDPDGTRVEHDVDAVFVPSPEVPEASRGINIDNQGHAIASLMRQHGISASAAVAMLGPTLAMPDASNEAFDATFRRLLQDGARDRGFVADIDITREGGLHVHPGPRPAPNPPQPSPPVGGALKDRLDKAKGHDPNKPDPGPFMPGSAMLNLELD